MISVVFKFKCPSCERPVKDPVTGRMLIPRHFIGDDCVGHICECGRNIGQAELVECKRIDDDGTETTQACPETKR